MRSDFKKLPLAILLSIAISGCQGRHVTEPGASPSSSNSSQASGSERQPSEDTGSNSSGDNSNSHTDQQPEDRAQGVETQQPTQTQNGQPAQPAQPANNNRADTTNNNRIETTNNRVETNNNRVETNNNRTEANNNQGQSAANQQGGSPSQQGTPNSGTDTGSNTRPNGSHSADASGNGSPNPSNLSDQAGQQDTTNHQVNLLCQRPDGSTHPAPCLEGNGSTSECRRADGTTHPQPCLDGETRIVREAGSNAQTVAGTNGSNGNNGANGANNAAGTPGNNGNNGDNGTNAANGTNGNHGNNGTNGNNGTAGPGSDAGENGNNGDNGVNGRNGRNGRAGTDGDNGQAGTDGVDGVDGRRGQQGIPGAPGAPGRDGRDGITRIVNQCNPRSPQTNLNWDPETMSNELQTYYTADNGTRLPYHLELPSAGRRHSRTQTRSTNATRIHLDHLGLDESNEGTITNPRVHNAVVLFSIPVTLPPRSQLNALNGSGDSTFSAILNLRIFKRDTYAHDTEILCLINEGHQACSGAMFVERAWTPLNNQSFTQYLLNGIFNTDITALLSRRHGNQGSREREGGESLQLDLARIFSRDASHPLSNEQLADILYSGVPNGGNAMTEPALSTLHFAVADDVMVFRGGSSLSVRYTQNTCPPLESLQADAATNQANGGN